MGTGKRAAEANQMLCCTRLMGGVSMHVESSRTASCPDRKVGGVVRLVTAWAWGHSKWWDVTNRFGFESMHSLTDPIP